MTEEELYLFDTLGFLRVKDALDPDTVERAYEGSQRIVRDYEHLLLDGPKGKSYGDKYKNKNAGNNLPFAATDGLYLPCDQ